MAGRRVGSGRYRPTRRGRRGGRADRHRGYWWAGGVQPRFRWRWRAGGAGGWLWGKADRRDRRSQHVRCAYRASRSGGPAGQAAPAGPAGCSAAADWAGPGKRIDADGVGGFAHRRHRRAGGPAGCSPDWSAAPAGRRSGGAGAWGVRAASAAPAC
ncbi:hypothetical protein BZL29_4056 [Mycobacterium kansasii]|uniref:Uncharacterized protein n=1 Tax=Mycobacterium kansasii TaxID=1768 RepID=A0A1V3X5Z7_MYCKA|nr:hypothetical protein BZL29_4056 [Mycobacterium kansasii]